MNENNIYIITIIQENNVINSHVFKIYCNNFNYQQTFYCEYDKIIFEPVIVPKIVGFIYLQVDNNIYYLNNNTGSFRVNICEDKFIVKLRITSDVNISYLNFSNNNYIESTHKYIYHQKLKTLIPEYINNNWNNYIKFISYGGVGANARKFITNFIGMFLKSPLSKFMIYDFIKKYNINYNKYYEIDYNSFNDFFTRRLLILPDVIDSTNDIRSSATCRIIVYSSINQDNFTSWIKGSEFTISSLINTNTIINSMMINRLAIQDYHHFHMPYTGILQNITILGNDYHSVSPSIINTPINVFTENYRQIYEFKDKDNKLFYIVAIGAFIIGSIENNLIIGNTYKSGDRIGNFSVGGSTIVVLFEKQIYFDPDISYYSGMNIESYVKVGDTIGSIISSRDVLFPKHYHIKNYDNILDQNNIVKIIIILCIIAIIIRSIFN